MGMNIMSMDIMGVGMEKKIVIKKNRTGLSM
jgi:hypothetical protein